MRAAAGHAAGTKRLACSISDNCLEHSGGCRKSAAELGADLVMVSCPNYFTNDLDMLIDYFGALAEYRAIDICLYDNPIASNTQRYGGRHPRDRRRSATDHARQGHRTSIEKVVALREQTALVLHSPATTWCCGTS